MSVERSAFSVERSAPKGAVFLSYASQDAEAAKRICEALRAAGVEVWFDVEGGLEHGDEWDAKIRRQIKECVLFIPVISANTQARHEGYFRLEWELAAQRAMSIASGVAFILPVVIDDTRDADALVPDRFRTVQWTKLPEGIVSSEVQQRLLKLWSQRTGAIATPAAGGAALASYAPPASPGPMNRRGMRIYATLGAVICVLLVWAGWWYQRKAAPPADNQVTNSGGAPQTEAGKLLARMAVIDRNALEATHEELVLAEELGAQVVALEPTNADGWAAYARATLQILSTESDQTRYAPALSRAQRAMSLAGEAFEPRLALALVYCNRRATFKEGLDLLLLLEKERPDDGRVLLNLAFFQGMGLGKIEEGLGYADRVTALPGHEATAMIFRAQILLRAGRIDEAEVAVDQSLALHVAPRSLMLKAYLQVFLRDDYEAAAAIIENIPGSFLIREAETANYGSFWLDYRQPEKALKLYRAFDGDFLDGISKGYYMGKALELAGRPEAAQYEWRLALKAVESKMVAQPDNKDLLNQKAMLLACLGEKETAGELLALIRKLDLSNENLTTVAQLLVRLDKHDEAITELITGWAKLNWSAALNVRAEVLHDAYFDPLRSDPRFEALVEEIRNDPRYPKMTKKAVPPANPAVIPAVGK